MISILDLPTKSLTLPLIKIRANKHSKREMWEEECYTGESLLRCSAKVEKVHPKEGTQEKVQSRKALETEGML